MKTVQEVSRLTGVSVRTLHYYDKIGLLKPTQVSESRYRFYDEAALERLRLILMFRELGFSLRDIGAILDAPDEERNRILEQQIDLLQQQVGRIQNRIHFARGIKLTGVKNLKGRNFDPKKLDDYSAQAETLYGKTEAWQEFKAKSAGRSEQAEQDLNAQLMDFFVRLGDMRTMPPESEPVQAWVEELRSFLTAHYYNCTPQILKGLGTMYAGGGSMTDNIDRAGGPGTGSFAKAAIDARYKE